MCQLHGRHTACSGQIAELVNRRARSDREDG